MKLFGIEITYELAGIVYLATLAGIYAVLGDVSMTVFMSSCMLMLGMLVLAPKKKRRTA